MNKMKHKEAPPLQERKIGHNCHMHYVAFPLSSSIFKGELQNQLILFKNGKTMETINFLRYHPERIYTLPRDTPTRNIMCFNHTYYSSHYVSIPSRGREFEVNENLKQGIGIFTLKRFDTALYHSDAIDNLKGVVEGELNSMEKSILNSVALKAYYNLLEVACDPRGNSGLSLDNCVMTSFHPTALQELVKYGFKINPQKIIEGSLGFNVKISDFDLTPKPAGD